MLYFAFLYCLLLVWLCLSHSQSHTHTHTHTLCQLPRPYNTRDCDDHPDAAYACPCWHWDRIILCVPMLFVEASVTRWSTLRAVLWALAGTIALPSLHPRPPPPPASYCYAGRVAPSVTLCPLSSTALVCVPAGSVFLNYVGRVVFGPPPHPQHLLRHVPPHRLHLLLFVADM